MTADADRDPRTLHSIMAPVSGKIAESILQLMQFYGIKKLTVKKLASANFERTIGEVECFPGIPIEVIACGVLIKDALAGIIASAGITRLEVKPESKDLEVLTAGYKRLAEMSVAADAAAAGSCDAAAQAAAPAPASAPAPAQADKAKAKKSRKPKSAKV